ncbi:MAG: hypothetical protein U1D41_07290 [Nitrosomonas sp.]|uniref:hypothetical protein n=1 Tax=Nitrosomonas sp. TaxID=42353 RepID=UPI002AB83F44|nr:hypothetical protein [Nitrosomonas sp.]MDZ4105950.1 hypothetical protein [Nitrosomonas sp.]
MRLEIMAVPHSSVSVRISWARLLKRVFEIGIEHCPHCGGNMKIIAAILERAAITKNKPSRLVCPSVATITCEGQGSFRSQLIPPLLSQLFS